MMTFVDHATSQWNSFKECQSTGTIFVETKESRDCLPKRPIFFFLIHEDKERAEE
jgi:hypothetical protein